MTPSFRQKLFLPCDSSLVFCDYINNFDYINLPLKFINLKIFKILVIIALLFIFFDAIYYI